MLTVLTQTPAFVSGKQREVYGHPDGHSNPAVQIELPGRVGGQRPPAHRDPQTRRGCFRRYRGELALLPKPPLVIECAAEFDGCEFLEARCWGASTVHSG